QLLGTPGELLDLDRADQKGELRVDVEMDELDCHARGLARPPRMGGQNLFRSRSRAAPSQSPGRPVTPREHGPRDSPGIRAGLRGMLDVSRCRTCFFH